MKTIDVKQAVSYLGKNGPLARENPDYEEILASIISRDERDSNRKIAPLKPADDAHIIDTSDLNLQEVINKILEVAIKNVW